MSQTLDFSEFRKVFENLEGVKDQIPAIKKEFVEHMSGKMLSTVRTHIGGMGKVQSWQEARVGSRSGYAAVSAKAKTYDVTKAGKQYAVGWITNAIENGHKMRGPPGKPYKNGRRYAPRVVQPRVKGRYFYRDSQAAVERLAARDAEELARKIAQKMEEAMSK